jgi:hypothetical protein
MRRRANRDKIHNGIVLVLQSLGATVQDLADVGSGCPDVLVGYGGRNYLFEFKTPGGYTKAGTKSRQDEWHGSWQGNVHIVTSLEEAMMILGIQEAV